MWKRPTMSSLPRLPRQPPRAAWIPAALFLLAACSDGDGHGDGTNGDGSASEAETENDKLPAPYVPITYVFQYWDHHLIQWLPESSRYETVEAFISDSSETPLIHFFYTEREARAGSKKQYHYANSPELAKSLCSGGVGERECYAAEIGYERDLEAGEPWFRLALDTQDGPANWLFVASGPTSAKYGDILIDNAEAAHDLEGGLLVFYLAETATAASTTTLTLGPATHPVEEWPPWSAEPYFTAYHGTHSSGVYQGYVPAFAPALLSLATEARDYREGAEWHETLTDSNDESVIQQTTLVLAERNGERLRFEDDQRTIIALLDGEELRTESITSRSAGHTMTLTFDPPIAASVEDASEAAWSFSFTAKENVMSGTLETDWEDGERLVLFDPDEPAWTRPLAVESRTRFVDGRQLVEARSIFPGGE